MVDSCNHTEGMERTPSQVTVTLRQNFRRNLVVCADMISQENI